MKDRIAADLIVRQLQDAMGKPARSSRGCRRLIRQEPPVHDGGPVPCGAPDHVRIVKMMDGRGLTIGPPRHWIDPKGQHPRLALEPRQPPTRAAPAATRPRAADLGCRRTPRPETPPARAQASPAPRDTAARSPPSVRAPFSCLLRHILAASIASRPTPIDGPGARAAPRSPCTDRTRDNASMNLRGVVTPLWVKWCDSA